MPKMDMKKKELKHLYFPPKDEPVLVDVPPMNYLMIDGIGNPNASQEFQDAIEALYGVSYTLKFMVKKENAELEWVVMSLEGLWWADNMEDFSSGNKDSWQWTLMIMQPRHVTEEHVGKAVEELERKKKPRALNKIRFEEYIEGKSAQIMHFGHFEDEGPTIEKLHSFIAEKGYALRGKHHEIYMSDYRKTAPEKLKTVIRQPVE